MLLLRRITLFLLGILLFLSCRKPVNVNWDVDLTLPVVKGELDIGNFFGDSLFAADNSGLLHFVLNKEVLSVKLDSVFKIPDTTVVTTFTSSWPLTQTLTPGQTVAFFQPSELEFPFGDDIALKLFDVRSGNLNVKFSNDLAESLDLVYVIPSATKNGKALTIAETIPPGINSLTKSYDLSEYHLNLRGMNGTKYNTIVQTYTLAVNPNANPVVVKYGQGAKVELGYTNIVPQYIEGYFGQQSVAVDLDTVRLDVGKTFKASNFMLDDVTMNFKIQNELGAEFTCNLSNITAVNSTDGKTITLNSSQLTNINLNRASKAGNVVYPSTKPISFTKSNSNIVPFISCIPEKMSYQGNVDLNPLGNISGYNDFAFYNTGLRVLAEIDVPLRYTANYFLLSSTSTVNFSNVEQLNHVNSGQFVVDAENGYPFPAQLQVYLKDEQGQVLDSVLTSGQNIIAAGQINSANEVTAPLKSQLIIPVDKAIIEALKKTKTLYITTYFNMPPNPPLIKIYEKYKFKLNIVAELDYNVEL